MIKKQRRYIVLFLFGIGRAAVGYADTDNSSSTGTQIPSSGDVVKAGDLIHFKSAAPIFTETFPITGNAAPAAGVAAPPAGVAAQPAGVAAPPNSAGTQKRFCAPPDSVFEVQSITSATKASGANGAPNGSSPTPANTQIVYGSFPSGNWLKQALHLFPKQPATNQTSEQTSGPCMGYTLAVAEVPYQFDASDISKLVIQRMGFTWGALVIPYKYYFTDKSFKGNPSTVLYAGYEGWFPGVSLAMVGSAGLGVAPNSSSSSSATANTSGSSQKPIASTTSTSNSNSTAATYTGAIGFIATFGGAMKAGLMFGRDYQGSGSGFTYNNKTWMALSIGTSF